MSSVLERPIFPLGVAHLPGDTVALRVFEDRYVSMVRDLLAGDEMTFGSVLITAGSEVGGGDRRADHGVMVGLRDCVVTDEGGYALLGTAETAITIVQWLPDAPYPRARVTAQTADTGSPAAHDALRRRMARLAQNIRTLLERVAEGATAGVSRFLPPRDVLFAVRSIASGSDVGVSAGGVAMDAESSASELAWSLWMLARAVPCGALDRLSVLATPGLEPRIGALESVVEHVNEVLDFGP